MLTVNIKSGIIPRMDYYSKHGAGVLASLICKFWRDRGFHGILCERFQLQPGVWSVRSNIGRSGYPPRKLI